MLHIILKRIIKIEHKANINLNLLSLENRAKGIQLSEIIKFSEMSSVEYQRIIDGLGLICLSF